MIPAERTVRELEWNLTLSALVRSALLVAVAAAAVFGMTTSPWGWLVVFGVLAGQIGLAFRTARRPGGSVEWSGLIAAGRFDEAERQIRDVIQSFWMLRSVKLLGLYQLAVLRHTQRQWRESAVLATAFLKQRPSAAGSLARATRLMLVDSLLELNDLPAVYRQLLSLQSVRLPLAEIQSMTVVQIDYEMRVGSWQTAFANIAWKVQLAELMPSEPSSRLQAMLAIAAKRAGRSDWESWLRGRVELIADVDELTTRHPALRELWA